MITKRSFSITINLETSDDAVDLGVAEDETYYAVVRALESFPGDVGETSWTVPYISREGNPEEWTEEGD